MVGVVAEVLGVDADVLRQDVKVTAPQNTRVLRISCARGSADAAAECAELLARDYVDVRQRLLTEATARTSQQLDRHISALEAEMPPALSGRISPDLRNPNQQVRLIRRSLAALQDERDDIRTGQLTAPEVLQADRPFQTTGSNAEVPVVSGALLGALLALLRAAAPVRSRRRAAAPRRSGRQGTGRHAHLRLAQ